MPVSTDRQHPIPDALRIDRALQNPARGPRILFFSGGSALKDTSQELVAYTHNSIHLVTPFDSGGSSAVLRRYFGMPAVGDLRSRLMALADRSRQGFPEIYVLFAYRLPTDGSPKQLRAELVSIAHGEHPLMAQIAEPMGTRIRHNLNTFTQAINSDFDLRGASIGNLILAAGFIESGGDLDPIVHVYSKLVKVRGEAKLLTDENLHLHADLGNGVSVTGQHLLTGKETPPLRQPIRHLSLVDPAEGNRPAQPAIKQEIGATIRSADLICYPIGSFYTSVIANLLPRGVGTAISDAPCPKVFIPNTVADPESVGLSLTSQLATLLRYARSDAPDAITVESVLNYILLDPFISYPGAEIAESELASLGVHVLKTPLTAPHSGLIDPTLLCQALVSLT